MIPSAVNLPLSDFPVALRMDADKFKEKYGFKKPKADQEVVFYCRSGMRSSTASDVARRNGYKKYAYPHTRVESVLMCICL
jgi:rhodanese-related sulfurtransferase